jgi:uncharacterized membrane protein YheB (UPF0754 family)
MKKSNIKKMVEECVREVLSESLKMADKRTQELIKSKFDRTIQRGLDFTTLLDNEEQIIKWYLEAKAAKKILRSQAITVAADDYVFFAQLRGLTFSVPNLKILAYGTKDTISKLIGKIKSQLPSPPQPSTQKAPPGDEERWAQYGGDPATHPGGLGT